MSLTIARVWTVVVAAAFVGVMSVPVLAPSADGALPRIGAAPPFTLTTQDDARLSLAGLRGKVLALTFIYASCADTCPILTAKMATLQSRLGPDFGPRVFFASISVDPERDTAEVLKRYAAEHGADLHGWAFLTGTTAEIRGSPGATAFTTRSRRAVTSITPS